MKTFILVKFRLLSYYTGAALIASLGKLSASDA